MQKRKGEAMFGGKKEVVRRKMKYEGREELG